MRLSKNNYDSLAGLLSVRSSSQSYAGIARGSDRRSIEGQRNQARIETPKSPIELLPSHESPTQIERLKTLGSGSLVDSQRRHEFRGPAISYEIDTSLYKNYLDRVQGRASQEVGLVQPEFLGLDRELEEAPLSNTDISLTQDDLHFLRGAIESALSRALRDNRESTEDDINSFVDESFGSGTSEILAASRVDVGDGHSEMRISQIAIEDLSQDDKETLALAFTNAKMFFVQTQEPRPIIHNLEVASKMKSLENLLGPVYHSEMNKLAQGLSGSGDGGPSEALARLRQTIEDDTTLSFSVQNQALERIDELSEFAESLKNTVSSPPLFEDLVISFKSGSYRRAFTPDEILSVLE